MTSLKYLTAGVFAALAPCIASAASVTVFDTSLPVVSGAFGAGTATTTDLAGPTLGRVTDVAGPSGGANRAGAAYVADQWVQRNVGGNGGVGITTEYARSGNGSAYFSGTGVAGAYKSDLEVLFTTPISAAGITGMGFDWYRDSSSTVTSANLHPTFRLMVGGIYNAVAVSGYLVFERDYNGGGVAPLDTWTTESFSNTAGKLWSTGSLPDAFVNYTRDLDDWDALISSLTVYGLSIGIGSGWNGGDFAGAIDNVSLTTGAGNTTWNFEVESSGTVPEPATLALVGLALAGLGASRRGGLRDKS